MNTASNVLLNYGEEYMVFFEGKVEIYLLLFLLIIPVASAVLCSVFIPKLILLAPFIALIAGLLLAAVFFPYYYTDIFSNSYDSTTVYWLYILLPAHFVISVVAALVVQLIRRRKTQNR